MFCRRMEMGDECRVDAMNFISSHNLLLFLDDVRSPKSDAFVSLTCAHTLLSFFSSLFPLLFGFVLYLIFRAMCWWPHDQSWSLWCLRMHFQFFTSNPKVPGEWNESLRWMHLIRIHASPQWDIRTFSIHCVVGEAIDASRVKVFCVVVRCTFNYMKLSFYNLLERSALKGWIEDVEWSEFCSLDIHETTRLSESRRWIESNCW